MYLPEDNKLTERDSAMKWVKVDKNEIISIQEKKFDNTMVYAVIAAGIGLALLTAVLVAFQNWDSLWDNSYNFIEVNEVWNEKQNIN